MQKVLKTISIVSLLGISTLTHIYANTFKYHPKNKQELLKLIRDNNVYLGDIDTSKITDMSGLFWVVPKYQCEIIANNKEKISDEQEIARIERDYQICLEVSVQEAELEKIKREDFSGIEKWNVSNVKDMSYMFAYTTSFNQPLDSWNVSKVKDMNSMFAGAESFNQPLDSWNVSKVKDMSYMFAGAESFNQPLNSWNVSNVKDMSYMFYSSSIEDNPPKWYKGN
ncbi:BspA family leucine-rich repeat surface protein [Helicobacter trogontum]|uniref:BspA family leucine-rich repeat surface protein n=1 Tax=Helicobacter trogontum TaxID=50960 RepID=A0A4U8SAJ2_9HELI|nr:BspA family leucine-rich repeat surface protein [Helicobacter trogontum]TLD83098.1 BspA family leucine-rich repeat surface protein [Helicobacter trogontum]